MKIPVETFEEHLGDGVLTWAFDHHDKGNLRELFLHSTRADAVHWWAKVVDGRGRGASKAVKLEVIGGAVAKAQCNCNAERQPVCRHAALAIMELAARAAGRGQVPETAGDAEMAQAAAKPKRGKPKRTTKAWSLASAVEEMGEEGLRGLVLTLAEQDPAIATAITLAQGHTDPKESKAKYSKAIKAALLKASGRAKKLPVAIEKEVGRIFDRFLDAVDRHFAADRMVTGSLQLMAICEELARMENRLDHESPAVAGPWRRAISMTARAAGFEADAADRKRLMKEWYKTAGAKVVLSSEDHVSVRAAGMALATTTVERAEAFIGWNLDSIDGALLLGFRAYLEGNVKLMHAEWAKLHEDKLGARRFFPHFYFRGDFDVAEKCAMEMTNVLDLPPDVTALLKEQAWMVVLEVAEAKPDPALLHTAHRSLAIWSQEHRRKHFDAFAAEASFVEVQRLGQELARTGAFITVESLCSVVEVLGRSGCEPELVDLAFNVLKRGFPVHELLPVAEWLRGPMQNMWTEFISIQAMEMAERRLFGNEKHLVAMVAEMKRAADAETYRLFRKEFLRSAAYRWSAEDILEKAEAESTRQQG